MTRLEWIKQASKDDLATLFCDIASNCCEDCSECLVTDMCRRNHCGFLDWLDAEARHSRKSSAIIVVDEKEDE